MQLFKKWKQKQTKTDVYSLRQRLKSYISIKQLKYFNSSKRYISS